MTNTVDLFAYLDYQSYLRDWFEQGKGQSKVFTLQSVSQKLGLRSRGHFHRIMHDPARPMSDSLRVRISELIGHTQREGEYWEALVNFGRAKTPEESRAHYRVIHRLQGNRRVMFRITDRYEYFRNWYLPVLREMVCMPIWQGDYADLAQRLDPPITTRAAKQGVALLLRLGLVKQDEAGVWTQADPVLFTGHDLDCRAIEDYQESMMDLSKRALRQVSIRHREINTVTLGVHNSMLPQIQALARKFQEDVIQLAVGNGEIPDAVYQLNVQCFPLTKIDQEK